MAAEPSSPTVESVIDGATRFVSPPPPPGPTELPDGCPITCLGTLDGVSFYLDAKGQFRSLKASEHQRLQLKQLFSPRLDWLCAHYKSEKRERNSIDWDRLTDDLFAAGAAVWSPDGRIKGRGTWRTPDGRLICHLGDRVLVDGEAQAPGVVGDLVFPADSALPAPLLGSVSSENGPAAYLRDLLLSWNWRGGWDDVDLLLGWIGCAYLSGALDWRPMLWIAGGAGRGKSTVQRMLGNLFGPWLLQSTDASPAGIWQVVKFASLPVAIDEVEPEADGGPGALVKLARHAASGGRILRGGADHKGWQATVSSCFLFSSVYVPSLLPQDRSRITVLSLDPLCPDAPEPDISSFRLAPIGRAILRRLIERFADLQATIELYRAALAEGGHVKRGATQFGTLLAVQHLLLRDGTPTRSELEYWRDRLAASEIDDAAGGTSDPQACLSHLLQSIPDVPARDPRMTREMIEEVAHGAHRSSWATASPEVRILARVGLRVVEDGSTTALAVSTGHKGTARLFDGTHWAKRSGGAGVWRQALLELPDAYPGRLRIGGEAMQVVLVPWKAIDPDIDAGPGPRAADQSDDPFDLE